MCLGINIDHVATIRNARGGDHPNPLEIAKIAENNNVDNITAHLREDRRHIKDQDIKNLLNELKVPLNFEMADTEEMINFAIENLPYACCIVPEKRDEITTEGGLNLIDNKSIYKSILELKKAGIYCSLFLDPSIKQIKLASELGVNAIEIHTGAYCNANFNEIQKELDKIKIAAKYAKSIGLEVHAGHGLNFKNVVEISKIREITELNIGHFIIGESISIGIDRAIKKMRTIIDKSREE
tara:strand:+ start:937 stop:1656 length:720 start_codon:yes stop_codon:yes gene_type:complete